MFDGDGVPHGQPLGDERTVAGLRVTLHAQQRRGCADRQRRHDRGEIGSGEDLGGIAAGVLGGEFPTRTLADPLAFILGVLELTQLGGGSEFAVMRVGDPGASEGRL